MLETTRTYRAKLVNHSQVSEDLDACGFSASKLWNVARYHTQQEWDDTGEIPSEADLKRELKEHERYRDLHSQSSQRVLEELAEAFNGWFKKRKNGDTDANPPGYRKRGDNHPRSTVIWKRDPNRVERGLYVCESCGTTMNADVNGAVNIRRKITQNPPTEDMSNGRLARPVAYLFDQTSGRFAPSEQCSCES